VYRNKVSLLLASQSPRRQQLLRQLGIEFTVIRAEIEELLRPGEDPGEFVRRMAREKAEAAARQAPGNWVLTADTIVVCGGQILGKPENSRAATRMLALLAGGWHQVLTAFTLKHQELEQEYTEVDSTRVKFSRLDSTAISAYVAGGEPLDKAGAYAVQGLGGVFVERLEGCPTTVIGLPLPRVVRWLLACRIIAYDQAASSNV